MILYILKFTACLAILLVFYKLFLERESIHIFKRFYLLGALVFSLIIPALVFTENVVVETPEVMATQPIALSNNVINVPPALESDAADIAPLLWGIYFIGVVFFGLKFLKNLIQILNRIRKNPKLKKIPFVQVLLLQNLPPHTFFKYIFLNKEKLEAKEIPAAVLLHEETHARQKHSLDVLFIELLQIIMWFNPLIYFIRKSIKLNHEFLADQAVLKKGITSSTYQNTLLSFMSPIHHQSLANAINYSTIKKRFTVMKSHTSKKSVFIRCLLLLPLLGILLLSFSQKNTVEVFTDSSNGIEGNWLQKNTENYVFTISNQNKNLVLHWGEFVYPLNKISDLFFVESGGIDYPLIIDEKTGVLSFWGQDFISEANSFRAKFSGEWESDDGKIKMSIKNYTNELIWVVTREGRTNRFYPKKTEDGFHFTYGNRIWAFKKEGDRIYDSEGHFYNPISKEKTGLFPVLDDSDPQSRSTNTKKQKGATHEQLKEYDLLSIKYAETESGKSRILVEEVNRLQYLYNLMTAEQRAAVRPLYVSVKSSRSSNQKGASRQQMRHYNQLATKYLQQPIASRTIPREDLIVLETIYNKMSAKQKKDAQPFPECLPPATKAQDGATREQMKEYNKLAKKYNNMPKDRMRILKKDVERLEYIYSLMSDKQKADAEPFPNFPEPPQPPQPPTPEVAVAPSVSHAPKLAESPSPSVKPSSATQPKLSPAPPLPASPPVAVLEDVPPPPPPPDPLDHIIELAKEGAIFYYERKPISSDKAIELVKDKRNLHIQVRRGHSKKPAVYLSKNPIRVEHSSSSKPAAKNTMKRGDVALKTGNIKSNGQDLFYTTKNGSTNYFNKDGIAVDKEGKPLKSTARRPVFYLNGKQISAEKAHHLLNNNTSLAVTSKNYDDGRYAVILTDLNQSSGQSGASINNPNSVIDLSEMISKNALFFLNNEPISSKKALWLTQNDYIKRIQTKASKNTRPRVYLWKKA